MKAVIFEQFGTPEEVLHVAERPLPEPGPGEVRVRILASPINPSDLLVVRGRYGRQPTLPATPGFEGVGIVDKAGPGVFWRLRLRRLGRRVAVLNGAGGNWQEYVVLPVRQLVPLPDAIPDEQAASFFVNPATAWILTRDVLAVPRGEWLLQTAAAGALGRMVIQLGRHYGFRTLNVVRRREQATELTKLGADAVVCTEEESLAERVRAVAGEEGVRYAIDAVGGETAASLVHVLGPGGRLVLYGTLSGEPMTIDPRDLMVRGLRIEGFWLSNWTRAHGPVAMLRLFRALKELFVAGVLSVPIAGTFALDQVRDAVRLAQTSGTQGKVLLRLSNT